MRRPIHLEQPLGVDAGIDLRGRERGVTEQFLDRAKVAAARQKMRREGMPQSVRRGAVGQAQSAPQPLHEKPSDFKRALGGGTLQLLTPLVPRIRLMVLELQWEALVATCRRNESRRKYMLR